MKIKSSIIQSEITAEEKQIVKMLADGIPGNKIAEKLGENYNSFAFKLGQLKAKCGATNTPNLVAYLLRNKLID